MSDRADAIMRLVDKGDYTAIETEVGALETDLMQHAVLARRSAEYAERLLGFVRHLTQYDVMRDPYCEVCKKIRDALAKNPEQPLQMSSGPTGCPSCDRKETLNDAFEEWLAAYGSGVKLDGPWDRNDMREAWFIGNAHNPPHEPQPLPTRESGRCVQCGAAPGMCLHILDEREQRNEISSGPSAFHRAVVDSYVKIVLDLDTEERNGTSTEETKR